MIQLSSQAHQAPRGVCEGAHLEVAKLLLEALAEQSELALLGRQGGGGGARGTWGGGRGEGKGVGGGRGRLAWAQKGAA